MVRHVDLLAFASLAFSLAVLSLEIARPSVAVDEWALRSPDAISSRLAGNRLRQRSDVNIEINNREAARGFSLPGCDGLLLVAVLPATAQGWQHIAPRLDLSEFRVLYAYAGALHERIPRFARLRDRLFAELAGREKSSNDRIVALAERGRCNLISTAATALESSSRGLSN